VKDSTNKIVNLSKELLSSDSYSLSGLVYENTKIRRHEIEVIDTGEDHVKQLLIAQNLRYTSSFTRFISNLGKDYGKMPKHNLPKETNKQASVLVNIIKKRRSIREFSGKKITLLELSTLLLAYKTTSVEDKSLGVKLRNAPSAGALYPLEIYITLPKAVDSVLQPGLYHYEPNGHYLTRMHPETKIENVEGFLNQPEIEIRKSAAIFYITAVLKRADWKYGDRALRYVLIEAGHLAQNLCLLATSINLGICPVGGFVDDEVQEYLNLDNGEEITLYILVLGKPLNRKYQKVLNQNDNAE
jgi:SagB-type dehydrogenase family enzyme